MGWVKLFNIQEVLSWKNENIEFSQKVSDKKSILHKARKHWDQVSFKGSTRESSGYQADKKHALNRERSDKKEPWSFLQPILKITTWRKDQFAGIRQFFSLDLQRAMGRNPAFLIQPISQPERAVRQNMQITSGGVFDFGAEWELRDSFWRCWNRFKA